MEDKMEDDGDISEESIVRRKSPTYIIGRDDGGTVGHTYK